MVSKDIIITKSTIKDSSRLAMSPVHIMDVKNTLTSVAKVTCAYRTPGFALAQWHYIPSLAWQCSERDNAINLVMG
jgi:hypothetical protein